MTDAIFMARLHGYAYAVQAAGYGSGPVPENFQPILAIFKNPDGTIHRERTLDSGFPSITGVERRQLLEP